MHQSLFILMQYLSYVMQITRLVIMQSVQLSDVSQVSYFCGVSPPPRRRDTLHQGMFRVLIKEAKCRLHRLRKENWLLEEFDQCRDTKKSSLPVQQEFLYFPINDISPFLIRSLNMFCSTSGLFVGWWVPVDDDETRETNFEGTLSR
jgi:hypothetical protein